MLDAFASLLCSKLCWHNWRKPKYGLDVFTVQRRFGPTGAFWHTAVRTMHSSWTYQCPPLCPIHLC